MSRCNFQLKDYLSSWWLNKPIWKILVKMGIFPNFRGEHRNYLKPPPSCRCFSIDMLVFWRVPKFSVQEIPKPKPSICYDCILRVLHPKYTLGSTNIAGWKMGAPDWADVFPSWKWGIYSIASYVMLVYQRDKFWQHSNGWSPMFNRKYIFKIRRPHVPASHVSLRECNTGRFRPLGHPTSPAIFACAWGHHYDHGSEFSAPRRPGPWVEQWRKP